jgi:hypothetical protein
MPADVYEMYHGTVAGLVESICRMGLRPSQHGGTLSSDLETAWRHACGRSQTDPVVLVYMVPGERLDEYFCPPVKLAPISTHYALKRDLPGSWMSDRIFKSDPRVAPFC